MEMQENQLVSLSAVEDTAKGNSGEEGEISLDISDDPVSAQNTNEGEDSETKFVEKRPSSIGSQISFRLRKVSQELRRKTSSKKHNNKKVERVESETARALRGLQFITKNVGSEGWSEVEKRFRQLSVNGALPKLNFGRCIGMDGSKEFEGELFDSLARRRGITSSSINEAELREFWEQITDESFDARLRTFFDMVDKNADGLINKEELKEIIALSACANKLSKIQEHAEEYATLIMEELDPGNLRYIEMQNLEMLFLQSAHLSTDSRRLSKLLSQKLVPTKEENNIKYYYEGLVYFTRDNWKKIWVMALWISICVGLFTWKFIQYKHRAIFNVNHVLGYCVCTAKGAAETLKFNMALILLPVCRNTLTWLRTRTKLGAVISFDDNIDFHKIIASGIGIGVGLHAGAHLTCDFPKLLHATDQEYEPMKPFFGEVRPKDYWWFIKGTEGWTGVVMLLLMSISFTLAQSVFRTKKQDLPKTTLIKTQNLSQALKNLTGFNAFWYSHHLFVVVYALFLVHGYYLYLSKEWYKKTTWMYLAVPITLYACERLIRAFRSTHKSVQILKFALHPGNVLALHMTKPQGFTFTSGQYLFIKCSAVSPFEWHPFSITSAPGEDYLSVHIRSLGDWTSQIRAVFSKATQPPSNALQGDNRLPKLGIDGPYGAPAQDYKEYDVILLVGLGIGTTPLISIVKDVFHNIKQQKDLKKGILEKENKPFATKRAYFYWVTREEGSFEWFKNVMNEVVENEEDGAIEIHNYCTSVYEEGDVRSALITMLQSINHAKKGLDIVSGTRVRTHFGRPNWDEVFKNVADNHPDQQVGVFYCGQQSLVGMLKKVAQKFSRNTSTQFDFHKENF